MAQLYECLARAAGANLVQRFGSGTRQSTTTELKVNYLRPIGGTLVSARAYLVRAGKTLCVSRVDIFDGQSSQSPSDWSYVWGDVCGSPVVPHQPPSSVSARPAKAAMTGQR